MKGCPRAPARRVWAWLSAALAACACPVLGQADERGISLDEAIEIGLRRNPNLAVADRGIDVAETRIRTASLPNNQRLAAVASANSQLPLTTIEFPDPANPGQTQRFTLGTPVTGTVGLQFVQPLLANKQVRMGKRSAREGMLSAEDARRTAELDIINAIKQTYYGVLLAMEFERVADEQVSRNRQHLRIAEALRDAGDAADLEVMQAGVDVADSEHTLRAVRGNVAQATAALNQAMGLEVTEPTVVLAPDDIEPAVYGYADIYELALGSRPEIDALDHEIKSAEWEVARAKTLNDPSLDLTGGYSYSIGNPFLQGNTFSIGLGYTVPFNDGGVSKAQRQTAQENVRLLQARRAPLLETLTQAESNLVQTVYEYRRALASLERAAGLRRLGGGVVDANEGEGDAP